MDVITLGESMVLLTPDEPGPLRYVNGFKKKMGGAESNVAIALSRLGHEVGWISKLGEDEFGLYIRNFIRGEGVDTSQVKFDEQLPTSVFFKEIRKNGDPKIYYYRKGSAFSSIWPNDIDETYFSKAKMIHLTGITPALSHQAKETIYKALELAHQNRQTVVFDPNIRFKLWSTEEAKDVLIDISGNCEIVLPGLDEGKFLTGEKEPENIAKALLNRKTRLVVIKLGEKGAYFATAKEDGYVPAKKVEHIVDTAGAGDGFAAGFISGLLRGWEYHQAIELGNIIGGHALGVEGDIEGYPTWNQINPSTPMNQILR